jgi:hypothetical protein
MIFGIPLQIAVKPNCVSVFDLQTKLLDYHAYNEEGLSLDLNARLSSTLIKFKIDWITEY